MRIVGESLTDLDHVGAFCGYCGHKEHGGGICLEVFGCACEGPSKLGADTRRRRGEWKAGLLAFVLGVTAIIALLLALASL